MTAAESAQTAPDGGKPADGRAAEPESPAVPDPPGRNRRNRKH
jgi:hypothetical protein